MTAPLDPRTDAQRYYDALRRITMYEDPEKIRRNSLKKWGLEDGDEAIGYAYENVLDEAKAAIKGKRRPK